jgi:uncharacterized protein YacL (UPF0231 family)
MKQPRNVSASEMPNDKDSETGVNYYSSKYMSCCDHKIYVQVCKNIISNYGLLERV